MSDHADENYIELSSGALFNPLDPDMRVVTPEVLAHSLSLLCRYNGQCIDFYSVAEHSVLALDHYVRTVQDDDIPDDEWKAKQRTVLLDDATEGLGFADLIRPLKRNFPAYKEAEAVVQAGVFEAYNCRPQIADMLDLVHGEIYAMEFEHVLKSRHRWKFIERSRNASAFGVRPRFLSPAKARDLFLQRLQDLDGEEAFHAYVDAACVSGSDP